MEITDLPPALMVLPVTGELVRVRTQRWALERWVGDDAPDLAVIWSRKPMFSVGGSRSCAELAVVDYLRGDGWDGVWVNAFSGELRARWFPAPAVGTLAEAGAPGWAAEIFGRLRAANGGKLGGFFDVFAWREPGEVRFCEVKAGRDRVTPSQRRFVEVALAFRSLEEFTIIEVGGPSRRRASRRTGHGAQSSAGQDRDGQGLVQQAGTDLLAALASAAGPDGPRTREILGDIIAAIHARMQTLQPHPSHRNILYGSTKAATASGTETRRTAARER
jgi:hypothetical protein